MKRAENKEKILSAGLRLIHNNGYHATGIQEIADAAEVPKGSFYNHFKSKEEFTLQAMQHYADKIGELLAENFNKPDFSPLANLQNLLTSWAKTMFASGNGCGCMIGNLAQEMGNQSKAIQDASKHSFMQLESHFAATLRAAQKLGELPPNLDCAQLAAFIYNGWQGALVRSKAEGSGQPLRDYVDFMFHQILPKLTVNSTI